MPKTEILIAGAESGASRTAGLPKLTSPAPMTGRSYRSSDSEHQAAMDRARSEGLTLTDVIRHYLREYVAGA